MPTTALFIDRFQPPHPDTLRALARACGRFDRVVVLVAGAQRPQDWRYPLSWTDRAAALRAAIGAPNLAVYPLVDALYDDGLWVAHVRQCLDSGATPTNTPTLLITKSPEGRSLARLFPDWDTEDSMPVVPSTLDAYYASTGAPAALRAEYDAVRQERAPWAQAEAVLGHPIAFNTVDAVIVQSHHVLLVERTDGPVGTGLLSLPGTFVGDHQTGLETVLATVRTKAGLDMPSGALSGRLANRRVFDHPRRDPRGWIRTEAFVFELPASGRMETAKRATWVPLATLRPDQMFADHFDIVQATTRGVLSPQAALLAGNTHL